LLIKDTARERSSGKRRILLSWLKNDLPEILYRSNAYRPKTGRLNFHPKNGAVRPHFAAHVHKEERVEL
jgi:hypothetical protein